jgi:protein-tyrosine phosphatase
MSVFDRLFSKKPKLANESFVNPITTEVHSHLIPGIDDGVQAIEESIEILKHFSSLGYRKLITTPHIMADFYQNGPDTILPPLEQLRLKLKEAQIPLELFAAAEYMIDDGLLSKIEDGNLLTFGKNHVLVEMPFTEPSANLKEILFALRINGYIPVLAHPERYLYFAANPEKYHSLWDAEVLFQVNLYSLVGYYSPMAQKAAEYLIENKMVSMVGSDTHGLRHLPVLDHALHSKNYERICELPLLNNQL